MKFETNEVTEDLSLNLQDFHARMYNYQVGRFTGIDKMADAAGQSSLTPYHFCADDPANSTDPTGLFNGAAPWFKTFCAVTDNDCPDASSSFDGDDREGSTAFGTNPMDVGEDGGGGSGNSFTNWFLTGLANDAMKQLLASLLAMNGGVADNTNPLACTSPNNTQTITPSSIGPDNGDQAATFNANANTNNDGANNTEDDCNPNDGAGGASGSKSQQDLTWAAVYANYPKDANGNDMPGADVYKMVGGAVYDEYLSSGNDNACALRLSVALNGAGATIPPDPGLTFTGANGQNYYLSASAMNNYLTTAWGPPNQYYTGDYATSENFQGSRGIYIMIPYLPSAFGASGHCTLFNGNTCMGGDAHCYCDMAYSISLWILNSQ